tara:strand:+ start:5363 stop:6136 length:774 start_codon:yes stop_codon:yes gene_type:complete
MPSSYLIRTAPPDKLAPWDRAIPVLRALAPGKRDRRKVHIENLVTTSRSSKKELKRLAKTPLRREGEHKKGSKFCSRRLKSRKPHATTLIFPSGNQVIAGTNSQSEALLAHVSFSLIIASMINTMSEAGDFKIQNIVASLHVGYDIDIRALSKEFAHIFSWDPKLFPGARAKATEFGTSVLLFSSGNGVITGAKCERQIIQTFEWLYAVVEPFFGKESAPKKPKGTRYDSKHTLSDSILDVPERTYKQRVPGTPNPD